MARVVGGAPLTIAVCVDVAAYEAEHHVTDGTWMEDASCAMMNIWLAARALELEGVWMQVLNRPDHVDAITPLLKIPVGVKVFAVAVLGYPAEKKEPHRNITPSRLHHNTW